MSETRVIQRTEEAAQNVYAGLNGNADFYSITEGTYNASFALRNEVEEVLLSSGAQNMPAAFWSEEYACQLYDVLTKNNCDAKLCAVARSLLNSGKSSASMVRRKTGSGVSPRQATVPLLLEMMYGKKDMNNAINYTAPNGSPEALDALRILEGISTNDSDVYSTDNIFIVPGGATTGVSMTMDYIADRFPRCELLTIGPSYFQFARNARMLGLKQTMVVNEQVQERSNGQVRFLPTPSEIEKSINSCLKAIVITQPNNPTGEFYDEQELRQIITLADENGLLIIDDAAFEDLVFPEYQSQFKSVAEVAREMGKLSCVVTIKSYSKGRNYPASRLGWIATTNTDYIEFANEYAMRKYDSPSVMVTGAVCLDALCRAVEMEFLRNKYETIEGAVEKLAPLFPTDSVSLPVENPDIIKLYIKQRMEDRRQYKESFAAVMDAGGFDAVSSVRAAYNAIVRVDEVPDNISLLDLALTLFARGGIESQWGPNFGGTDDEWRKNYGAWMRISFSSSAEYLIDGIGRSRLIINSLLENPDSTEKVQTNISM
tara:strand:- start:1276 stop:2907 length:1632 start_codon:yes stop_codon:yes gene_type:complete